MTSSVENQNHELKLVTFLEGLGADTSDGVGIHLRLSGLQRAHRQPFHKTLVLHFLRPFADQHRGEIYQIHSGDLVLVMREMDAAQAETMCDGLRTLFAADPLTQAASASKVGTLAEIFPFDRALDDFKQLADRLATQAKADREASEAKPQPTALEPIDARHIPQIQNALGGVDLGPLVRRETICAAVGGAPPRPVMAELSVDFDRLGAQLLPHVDLSANRWYQHALNDLVLERFLAWFNKEKLPDGDDTVSIDASLASLMSDTFLEFDRLASEARRKRVIFELQESDLFADMGAALFLRDYLQDRGYRVSLDGTNHLTLPLLDRARLGFDFLKLRWGPDFETVMAGPRRDALTDAIDRAGQARVVLFGCESARAVGAGQQLGINLFQGPYTESLLRFADKPKASGKAPASAEA